MCIGWALLGAYAGSSPLNSCMSFRSAYQRHHNQFATFYLLYLKLPRTPNHYAFTLKLATTMFSETSENTQHSTWSTPKTEFMLGIPAANV
jgi:hypothetical protein